MFSRQQSPVASYLLRVDRVGSYRLILSDVIRLGGPGASGRADLIQILGPLSREHAVLRRDRGVYLLSPAQGGIRIQEDQAVWPGSENLPASTNTQGTLLAGATVCTPGRQYEITSGITCRIEMPSPLSLSAKLVVNPGDRLMDRVDGTILMDHLLILGPGEQSHVVCRHWERAGALVHRDGEFWFRAPVGVGVENGGGEEKIDLQLPLGRYVGSDEIGLFLEPHASGS